MYLFFSFVWLSLVFKPWLFLYPDIPAGAGYLSGPRIWTMPLEDELTTAAAKGDAAQVRILLGSGAQVNGVNRFGCTALQVSVMFPNFYCRRWRSRQTAHAFLDAPLDSYQVHWNTPFGAVGYYCVTTEKKKKLKQNVWLLHCKM